jgi:ferritin-like metal-binding protein YciE
MSALNKLFLEELADRYDSEKQLVQAIPKLVKLATCKSLQEHFESHLKETEGHVKKLETVFKSFDAQVKAKKCEATMGLLKEGEELAAAFKGSPAINAALISAAQKIEHYEIASYGCLHAWATLLGNDTAANVLEGILKEEKAANDSFIKLAGSCCNQEALVEDTAGGSGPDRKDRKSTNTVPGSQPLKTSQPRPGLVEH